MKPIELQIIIIKNAFDKIAGAKGKAKEAQVVACVGGGIAAKHALRMLLDPGIVFHIGDKSFIKSLPREKADEVLPKNFFDLCDRLSSARALSDNDVATAQWTIKQIESPELQQFARDFLCKNISLGVTSKTVNRALGYEFVPEFRCMLANKYFEHPDKVEGKHFYLTEKLDGIRCIAKVTTETVKLFSRQGQPIEGLLDIEAELLETACRLNKSFAVDGELLVSDRNEIPSKEQYKRTTMIVRKDGPKSGITYNVFDILDLDAFENRRCEMPYYQRRQRLETYFPRNNYVYVKTLPILYHGSDTSKILFHLDVQRSCAHEGIMINLADEYYQFTRTNALLKVKVMQDCDLEIIGVQEGQGKFAGTLGALICNYKGTPVGVGSGLSDEMRHAIWSNPNQYIGRVATIQYFEQTNDANGKLSIRFPVFKELREEGKEVSYA